MRLASVRIQNFRSFEDQTIELSSYTCLVGPNGSGKSNVLRALNLFFRDTQSPGLNPAALTAEDFHHRNTNEPITITLTFTDLSEEAQHDFKHYHRQGKLIVSAIAHFNSETGSAEVRQHGQRLGIKEFSPFFEADANGQRVAILRDIYRDIYQKFTTQFPELEAPSSRISKRRMNDSLRRCEEAHLEKCVPILSKEQFYGVSKGVNLLEKYIQWVYVPAVKDVSAEDREARETALGKLLQRTVRAKVTFDKDIHQIRSEAQKSYEALLKERKEALAEVSQALSARLAEWAHPDAKVRLEWDKDRESAVRIADPFARAIVAEGDFEGTLTCFGHGFQRAYLLALLHELSESGTDTGPTLLLACEEPELYQHPPQARHLYNVLLKLAEQNAQIVVSTHSPYFISGHQFESIRLIRKTDGKSIVRNTTACEVMNRIRKAGHKAAPQLSGALAKIHQALQPVLSEMFFAPKIILVEGLEDAAYITTYMALLDLWEEYRRLGCHVIPAGGKSEMIQPLTILHCLEIPTFAVFDADGHKSDKDGRRAQHQQDNIAILHFCGVSNLVPFPLHTLWHERCVMWSTEIAKIVGEEIGDTNWEQSRAQADREFGHTQGLRKSTLHIARSLQIAWEAGNKSASLQKLCEIILEFARKHT